MKTTQDITIVLLLVTASVLTAMLLASYVYTEPAGASTTAAKGGDYLLATGTFNQETDFVYILDIATNKLNIYYPNINTNALALGDTVDLSKVFGGAGAPRR
ncbi:MAG TPA: hypothetical protein VM031_01955 [Phycisphaerae bacterium]|nr:hypothetical protein [Phycisphaerae bacterium]